jgi:CelD/BcsL family acetyltransferase involved in cellulose biosynthesis
MTTVVAEALRYAIEHRLRSANLSTGNDVSKTRWGPSETVYRDAVTVSPTMRAQLAHKGYQLVLKAKADPRVRNVLRRYVGRRQGPTTASARGDKPAEP